MKLKDIRPHHLNELYKDLAEYGVREENHRAGRQRTSDSI